MNEEGSLSLFSKCQSVLDTGTLKLHVCIHKGFFSEATTAFLGSTVAHYFQKLCVPDLSSLRYPLSW